jgi:O-antigen/teichoic acid export membrane protein
MMDGMGGQLQRVLKVLRRNLGIAVGLKLLSLVLQFCLFPLLIKEMGKGEYGVWVVLQSTVFWFVLLDLGIGMGLRNKLIESINLGQEERASRYIASAMIGQGIVWCIAAMCVALVVFWLGIPWATWMRSATGDGEVGWAIYLSFMALAWNQCFGVTNAILVAKHWNGLVSTVSVVSTLGLLCYVICARASGWQITLLRLSAVSLFTYVVAHSIQAWVVFRRFPGLVPRLREFRWGVYREVLFLGGQFLVLEVTYLLIFATDRFVALRYLGPEVAAEYDVMLRFIALITTGYSMVIGPMWGLAGAHWAKRDLAGLDLIRRIALLLMLPFGVGAIVLGYVLNWVIHRWVDPTITISRAALVLLVIYGLVVIWSSANASLLNGIGRVREQAWCSAIACVINLPLAITLCQLDGLGSGGILLASVLSLSLFAVVGPFVWLECRRQLRA